MLLCNDLQYLTVSFFKPDFQDKYLDFFMVLSLILSRMA